MPQDVLGALDSTQQ